MAPTSSAAPSLRATSPVASIRAAARIESRRDLARVLPEGEGGGIQALRCRCDIGFGFQPPRAQLLAALVEALGGKGGRRVEILGAPVDRGSRIAKARNRGIGRRFERFDLQAHRFARIAELLRGLAGGVGQHDALRAHMVGERVEALRRVAGGIDFLAAALQRRAQLFGAREAQIGRVHHVLRLHAEALARHAHALRGLGGATTSSSARRRADPHPRGVDARGDAVEQFLAALGEPVERHLQFVHAAAGSVGPPPCAP